MKQIIKNALILFAITLVAGIGLGLVHEITLEPIATAQAEKTKATYQSVFSDADSFQTPERADALIAQCNADAKLAEFGSNVSVQNVSTALDASGNPIGFIVDTCAKGYNGNVYMSVGINNDARITGVGFLKINETPGLGMKANTPAFTGQFPDMRADGPVAFNKTGPTETEFQALSGATYTSKAVSGCVNAAIYFVNQYLKGEEGVQ